jgi:hypothetical protein
VVLDLRRKIDRLQQEACSKGKPPLDLAQLARKLRSRAETILEASLIQSTLSLNQPLTADGNRALIDQLPAEAGTTDGEGEELTAGLQDTACDSNDHDQASSDQDEEKELERSIEEALKQLCAKLGSWSPPRIRGKQSVEFKSGPLKGTTLQLKIIRARGGRRKNARAIVTLRTCVKVKLL